MAATIKTWVNLSTPRCEDDDLNGFKSENNNLIIGSGQALTTADLQQTHKAVAHYAAVGDYYIDSGSANTYVLSTTGAQVAPPTYANGMRVRFLADNGNTGASTVNVDGLGVKSIKTKDGADLPPGVIQAGIKVDVYYNGVDFILSKVPVAGTDMTWIRAALVGNSLAIAAAGDPALAALNGTDVAFIDSTNDSLRTYRFDGTDWAQVGNSLAITVAFPALAALNGTDVAFIDGGNDELRTYRFDGTDWAQVGNSLAITAAADPALAALNGTDVAFVDSFNDELRTYRFDGTDWAQVGNGLAIAGVGFPALAALNGTDVAFIDSGNDELRTIRFDGTDWLQVGNSLAIAGVSTPALAALNGTDVAFIDSGNDELRTIRFDGTDWLQVGNSLAIATANIPALAALNGTDVAFIDSGNDELRTYRFAFYIGEGPHRP